LLDRFEYDPFGVRTTAVGSDERMHRGYTGHEELAALDLVHMNGRVQDPLLGRFLSPDPFVQAPYHSQSLNRYAYVWNNPLSLVDPSGFQTCYDASGPDLSEYARQLFGGPSIEQILSQCGITPYEPDDGFYFVNEFPEDTSGGDVVPVVTPILPPLAERERLRSWDDLAAGEKFFYQWMAIGRSQYETWPQELLDEMLGMQMASERMSWGAGSGGGAAAGLGAVPRSL
jgi:RHS repeat-associated protein